MPLTTFQQYLQSAFTTTGLWSSDEVVAFILPLFEEVLSFHENNEVGPFEKPDTIFLTNNRLDIDENFTHAPILNLTALEPITNKMKIDGYSITERITIDSDVTANKISVQNLQVQVNPNAEIELPVYLPGYQCYEIKIGHHDAQTDIFCLGLILGSVIMGLDLYDIEDLNQFVQYRSQPAGLNSRVHPTLHGLVTDMTELDRNKRSRDLAEIVQRIKYYRDYDPQREIDLSMLASFEIKKPSDRRGYILSKLRNRLFDISRRNRLLYYKANSRFVNLTVSSVPMVLHYQSINPQLLFTWNKEISTQIVGQKDITLNKYLRFEDHPYLNSQLNSIRQQSVNDEKEYGFSQLRLAVAFLQWHNLKESPNERIVSPLLLLPVKLERKKSLKEERFTLKISDNTAVINPVLSNHLKDLYGILLPDTIDLDDVSMEAFFQLIQSKIEASKQGVKLNYIDQPRIKIVYNVARQTINTYRKKLKLKGSPAFHQIDYSYSEDNYKPLGLELFRQKIEPQKTALEFLIGVDSSTATNNFSDTSTKGSFHISDGENNPYSWDFDVCNIVLGNFNYKKMSLVSDYNKITDNNVQHLVFNELFSNEPKNFQTEDVANDPKEWYHVISADPTQTQAVNNSRTGKSYIIQGPPGTGKSQTITNLIADFLANGKTILFICEKRAALDVVYHRLQQNKLSELCCYIHDSQGDKKEFIKDLKVVYEDFLKNKMDLENIVEQRKYIQEQLISKTNLLNFYHSQQRNIPQDASISTRKLIERLIEVKNAVPSLGSIDEEMLPYYSSWVQFGDTINQLGNALQGIGATNDFANHSLSKIGNFIINSDNPIYLVDSISRNSLFSIQQITQLITQYNIPNEYVSQLDQIKQLLQDAVVLESLARSRNLGLVDLSNDQARKFDQSYTEYRQITEEYQGVLNLNKRWISKFDKEEIPQSLELAERFENSFFNFLNGNWRRLKKTLKQSYDFSSHKIAPTFSGILKQLQEEYKVLDKLSISKSSLQKEYNSEDIDNTRKLVEELRSKIGDKEVDYLLRHSASNDLVIQLSKLNNTLSQLEIDLQKCLYKFENKSIEQINSEIKGIVDNSNLIKDLLPNLRKVAELPENLQNCVRKLTLSPLQFEAAMANKTIQEVYLKNSSFAQLNFKALQETVGTIEDEYKKLLQVNANYIRAKQREKFLSNYDLSNTSVNLLTQQQRQIKKEYTDGRRILEHEMSKTMRYKSIREIASSESGRVLRDIKPVWLMSPLSVSDSLPLDTSFFDVVIFDEASQITLEEGIPALFRAPQTIIVGDDKQMPPSNFFNAKSEDPEDLETIDGEKEDEILSADSDSLLVQGSRKLNSTMLSWHYRSRYENLISYSNHAFYESSLLTVPDKTTHNYNKPLLEVQHADEGWKNYEVLLNQSISFHYLPNSIYEARSNINEANYIAQLVKGLLMNNAEETIGVVAFSQEQQGVIEEAISNLAVLDRNFEELLEKAYNRKDDNQFTGLFIKNLENVQGDERDIIIMSVCYGHDSNKKMLMNFGPINKKGGEKRLNVIFSRAKKHMAVISSIRHSDITNEYNDGANYFKRFLYYAEMVSIGNMKTAQTILENLASSLKKNTEQKPSLAVTVSQIKKVLEEKGFTVDEKVGQSSFKCTLGVKCKPEDASYSLGILLDDDDHYSNNNVIEQYFQRPAILQAFGWKTLNVYAKDWLEDDKKVIGEILKNLDKSDN